MKEKLLLSATLLLLAFLLIASGPLDPAMDKGMKQVPFEVINKSGQEIHVRLYRYEDDYPSKSYYFSLSEGTRKRPKLGKWEVWKGNYNLIVFGSDMSECLLPIDLNDKEAGIEFTIKGRFRLVVPPCQEIFTNPGEKAQLKYDWANSFSRDEDTGNVIPYRNWFTILGS